MMKYYNIMHNDNDRKYAYFKYAIKWNISAISKTDFANGYIVQKVSCFNNTSIGGIELKPYYEAWNIIDGKCLKSADNEPDDVFDWGTYRYLYLQIFNSLGKSGSVVYRTQVYWIDKNNCLYDKVGCWEKGGVYAAGNLKSCYVYDFPDLDTIEPLFERPDFVHQIDFVDPMTIENSILDCGREFSMSKDVFRDFVENILENTEYQYLTEQLLIEYC